MKIYFVRHGQTDFNINKIVMPGEIDHALNETGIQQAERTRDQLANKKYDFVISSPMQRARRTAEIINESHGQLIVFDERLRERVFGKVVETGGVSDSKIWHQMFDFDDELIIEGGERVKDFFVRVYEFLDEICEKYPDKTILIVSHGGVRHAFHAYFNRLEWKGNLRIERTGNAEVVEYNWEGGTVE